MDITHLAQSTLRIINDMGQVMLIDPGKYNLDMGIMDTPELLQADIVVITHRHADHFSSEIMSAIADQSKDALVIVQKDMRDAIEELGVPVRVVETGDIIRESGFAVKIKKAIHVVRGEEIPCFGIVVEAGGKRIFFTSDTNYITRDELKLDSTIDWIVLPFSGRGVTMNADEACELVKNINPVGVIPVHYDSPKDSHLDPDAFALRIEMETGSRAVVLRYGETLEV